MMNNEGVPNYVYIYLKVHTLTKRTNFSMTKFFFSKIYFSEAGNLNVTTTDGVICFFFVFIYNNHISKTNLKNKK